MRTLYVALCLLILLPGCSLLRVGAETAKSGNTGTSSAGLFKVGQPYQIQGQWYYPQESYSYEETGIASWYGPGFHGNRTANGEIYHQGQLTAAHRTLQLPSFVRVTNLSNGKSVVLRVNDRGPFARGRVIDVSEQGAILLGFRDIGTARVRVQVLPEASRQVAQAAREGRVWTGAAPDESTGTAAAAGFQTATATSTSATPRPYEVNGQPIPAHEIGGDFYPDPVVTPRPVPASTAIYIQAGSFSQQENALRLARKLEPNGSVAVSDVSVNGATYHRVRIGPIPNVAAADRLLSRVAAVAPEAKIVVD